MLIKNIMLNKRCGRKKGCGLRECRCRNDGGMRRWMLRTR